MTTLVCSELIDELSQTVNLTHNRIYHVSGIKIRLVMFNSPSGTFKLSLKQNTIELTSAEFTCDDIKNDLGSEDDYGYIYKALNFSLPLKKGTYELVLSSSGYTFNKSSFLGWVKSYENIFNEQVDPEAGVLSKPFDYLIYEKVREDLL